MLDQMLAFVAKIRSAVPDQSMILFHELDDFYGAVRVYASWVLSDPLAVWAVTHGDLALAADDLSTGICIETNFYDWNGQHVPEGVYELTAWGDFAGV